ncbi:glycosyltransferase family 4 protein [Bordetella avium]|uniref:Glycosyl transferase n=2 Tax=Bordetella avium TaxID=521 RepID=Q2L1S6_BORA1|nr:glycosyltransferase family 4 protein [Bordetella avium]WQE33501.1 glycosyltransferase family 4 protein [Bordetella avium]CAD21025.1 putative glycosyl transferase [Bordetella avium 197N]CAJ47698.1 putative glycosyl transferase [Bordetella avium 197N]SUV70458.1 glycosyl transferase [Bordetella avium]
MTHNNQRIERASQASLHVPPGSRLSVALLSDAGSIHTMRWVHGLHQRGLKVHLISIKPPNSPLADGIEFHRLPWKAPHGYRLNARYLRQLLKRLQPDLLNAHYATGYGLLARLSRFSPVLLSAWGSDIYEFPTRSSWHRKLLRKNLESATCLAATSHAMAARMQELSPLPVTITPFGIDTELFSPGTLTERHVDKALRIGTVKSLEDTYGIDTLLEAYARLYRRIKAEDAALAQRLQLLIYGRGSRLDALSQQARDLAIDHCTTFAGHIEHHAVPDALRSMDIFAALSRADSFGVAILEASACRLPVVVSDADGPAEIVEDQHTGFIVPRENAEAAAQCLYTLVMDSALRERMGRAGRQLVDARYSWNHSVDIMLAAYRATIENAGLGQHSGRAPTPPSARS